MQETFCALFIAATTLAAQSTSPSDWAGVWQGELDGQPSVVLTLARDNGTLEGTLVLNVINAMAANLTLRCTRRTSLCTQL